MIDPLLHDALEVMANAEGEFKIRCSPANRQKDTRRCKIKRQGDKCGSTVDFMKRVSNFTNMIYVGNWMFNQWLVL